jgi:hypothetical protein
VAISFRYREHYFAYSQKAIYAYDQANEYYTCDHQTIIGDTLKMVAEKQRFKDGG